MFNLLKMMIDWATLTKRATHFVATVFAFFWMRYILDAAFRHDVWSYVHTMPGWAQGLFGFALSFYMWYHNPVAQKRMAKEMKDYDKTQSGNQLDLGNGTGNTDGGGANSASGSHPSDH